MSREIVILSATAITLSATGLLLMSFGVVRELLRVTHSPKHPPRHRARGSGLGVGFVSLSLGVALGLPTMVGSSLGTTLATLGVLLLGFTLLSSLLLILPATRRHRPQLKTQAVACASIGLMFCLGGVVLSDRSPTETLAEAPTAVREPLELQTDTPQNQATTPQPAIPLSTTPLLTTPSVTTSLVTTPSVTVSLVTTPLLTTPLVLYAVQFAPLPPSADITLQNASGTPLMQVTAGERIVLSPGNYTFTMQADGHNPYSGTFQTPKDSLVTASLTPLAPDARVTFTTTPANAAVYVAGRPVGTSPITVSIPKGVEVAYEIRPEKGYHPHSSSLTINGDATHPVWLEPLPTVTPVARTPASSTPASTATPRNPQVAQRLNSQTFQLEQYRRCQSEVSKRLLFPETAVWPNTTTLKPVVAADSGLLAFNSHVDSDDGLGGVRRTSFLCRYRDSDNSISVRLP